MEVTYKVSDFKRLISESSNEFKAKIGDGVEGKDKQTNGKAYTDAKKRAKDFDGGAKQPEEDWARGDAKYEKTDFNKTMLDVEPENATPEYKKRVKKLATADGDKENEKIYNAMKKSGKEIQDAEEAECKKGLVGRTRPNGYFAKENAFESRDGQSMRNMIESLQSHAAKITESKSDANQTIDLVKFKKTEFINEEHMIKKIPDDVKLEGKMFKMRDKSGSEYLVEWKGGKANILEHSNPEGVKNSLSRFAQLAGYSSEDSRTTNSSRLNENDERFEDTLNKMRKVIK